MITATIHGLILAAAIVGLPTLALLAMAEGLGRSPAK
jgi:hypothetical protein